VKSVFVILIRWEVLYAISRAFVKSGTEQPPAKIATCAAFLDVTNGSLSLTQRRELTFIPKDRLTTESFFKLKGLFSTAPPICGITEPN